MSQHKRDIYWFLIYYICREWPYKNVKPRKKKKKMKEHNEQEHCTDYDVALQIFESNAERGIDKIYDAGRYEAFIEILNSIKEIK